MIASGVPGTMSAFQKLLGRIDGGNIPMPLDAPSKSDFPKQSSNICDDDEYLPLEHPCDMPWPRGFSRDEIGPVWDKKDCDDKSLNPIARGGETLALERLQKSVSARPDW